MHTNVFSFYRPSIALKSCCLFLCVGVASGCDDFTCADYATCPVESDGAVSDAVPDAASITPVTTGEGPVGAETSSDATTTMRDDASVEELTDAAGPIANTLQGDTGTAQDAIATETPTTGISTDVEAPQSDSSVLLPVGDASPTDVDSAPGSFTNEEPDGSIETVAPDAGTSSEQSDYVSITVDASCDGTRCADEADSGPVCGDGVVDLGEVCDVSAAWCRECKVVPAIAAGAGHTCALLGTGGVKCWGSRYSRAFGQ